MIYLILGVLFLGAVTASKGEAIVDYLDEKTDAWTRFDSLFKKYGPRQKVPWQWLKSFCLVESDLGRAKSVQIGLANPKDIENSKSSDGLSWGIMQVTVPTAKDFDPSANQEKLNNPEFSVDIASQYIRWCMNQFSEKDPRFVEWVVKSYNQGVGNTLKEMRGTSKGYAGDYWIKWQKQLARVNQA